MGVSSTNDLAQKFYIQINATRALDEFNIKALELLSKRKENEDLRKKRRFS